MFRFGIRRLEQFSSGRDGLSGKLQWLLTRGCLSYELLDSVRSGGEAEMAAFDTIVRDLRISAGVCRTTARGRFRDFDPVVMAVLSRVFPTGAPLRAHDWAASDCLTSAEWAQELFRSFPQTQLAASDLLLCLVEVTLPDGGGLLIVEPSGHPLQYIQGPFVCRMEPREAGVAILNRVLADRAWARWKVLQASIQPAIDQLISGTARTAPGLRKLPLVHPVADALAASDARFSIFRHSAFEALAEPVDVIRTMNIFNLTYFAPERLTEGAAAVFASLRPGGVWVVGRTSKDDATHTATVFQREAAGFRPLERVGGGSEIEPLVLETDFERFAL